MRLSLLAGLLVLIYRTYAVVGFGEALPPRKTPLVRPHPAALPPGGAEQEGWMWRAKPSTPPFYADDRVRPVIYITSSGVQSAPAAPYAPMPTSSPATAGPTPAALAYTFPVHSSGKISYGRYHHDYPAADIFCPIGSEFVAPTSGIVDWVSDKDIWDPASNIPADRGGLSVAIIGDDGVRYYGSHLSAVAKGIAPGERVSVGQLLGLTGKSGDARGTAPHLHFGISRPTSPEDWQARRGQLRPYEYLKCWQKQSPQQPCKLAPADGLIKRKG